MKRFLRWPTWLIFSVLVLITLVPAAQLLHGSKPKAAHAVGNSTPTITLSKTVIHPHAYTAITVSVQGFTDAEFAEVYFDSMSNSIGIFNCDGSGNCSGIVSLPNGVQGQHIITVVKYLDTLSASASITFLPNIYKVAGRPGLPVQLNGAAFTANETVKVYWGTATGTFEGTTTTDATGNFAFSFTLPTGLTDGLYPITVVRTNQKPATVISQLKVYPVTLISTPGIRGGQQVHAYITGFLPLEGIDLSWNANGGQAITTIWTDDDGSAKTTFYVPSAPPGAYTLTATGETSGQHVTNSLNIGPGLSQGYGNPGRSISVNGAGFTPNEAVNVYFQTPRNGVVPITADATGAFSVQLTVPTTYSQGITYFLHAVSTTGSERTEAKFTFFKLSFATYGNAYYNQPITFTGANFAVGETINIIWNYQHAGQFTIGTVQADANGDFDNLSLITPSTPNQNNIAIAAVGTLSKLTATTIVSNYPVISLNPTFGKTGAKIQVDGGSFGSAETINISFQGTPLGSTTTQADGTFATTFTVPTVTGAGNITIQAVGVTSSLSATTLFTYIPILKASPHIVTNGDTITVTGKHFSANSPVTIEWINPSYYGFANTDANGSFTTTLTVSGLRKGTYYMAAYDHTTNYFVSASIVVQ